MARRSYLECIRFFKYFRFHGRHFEFSVDLQSISIHIWSTLNSSNLNQLKSALCFHFCDLHGMLSCNFRFGVRHLEFWQNGASHNIGNYTTELPGPENMGIDVEIMFLSRRIVEIR